ncbi:MAG: valine--tRNA ligase [Verrucomicrobia bacterium]|nr:valine--tRNA ligase [Verrucomicrobiota bacterium]
MDKFATGYEAASTEKKWYQFWEKEGFFKADPSSGKPPYCIVIPPPNVTGVLHMGHALVNTLQDILIRWKRMSGYDALWMPGTDHAGISTQTVVERHLLATEGKRRSAYTREQFVNIVWAWKEKSETEIIRQLKSLGASCDWSRQRFTMDPAYCMSVRTMFKKLFTSGHIYHDFYLVNWDPVTQTAIADDEVEYEERNSFLWHFSYQLIGKNESIQFATTRPETMLGDTAVAVNPKDCRFSHMIGKMLLQPITGRPIPVIADDHVDPSFGTGAVKVTPAHDHDDYLMGQRHNLPMINIMTPDGKINENGGEFAGMTMEEAREAITQVMKDKGLFVKQVPHLNRVGVSYRSKAVIEPYLSKQWFVKMSSFKHLLKDIVRHGETKLVPSHWNTTYFHWIDNLHDWCISRQLWWGHQIPIWYHKDDKTHMICHDGPGVPEEVTKHPEKWQQDPDVLDTWFSSALWPFATLGWPEKTEELAKYYPNSTLITGHDILFFWVARMLMMGHYAFGKVPFGETFLHGLIYGKSYWKTLPGVGVVYATKEERLEYDRGGELPKEVSSKWEKMSKSKGNIIDPLEVIEKYGADAIRMALASSTTEAPQIDLDMRRFEEYRNFANKIWNSARFVFLNIDASETGPALSSESFSQGLDLTLLALEDHWILGRLASAIQEINKHLQAYAFDKVTAAIYDFYWNEFCAYYLEICKPVLFGKQGTREMRENKQKLLTIVLLASIRLMHPLAPYITEEIFQKLKELFTKVQENASADPYTQEAIAAINAPGCIVAPYPQATHTHIRKEAESEFDFLSRIVYAIRNIRGEMKIPLQTATDVYIVGDLSSPQAAVLEKNRHIVSSLVKIKELILQKEPPQAGPRSSGVVDTFHLFVSLPQEMVQHERARLAKEEERLRTAIAGLDVRLANRAFVEKAPQHVVDQLVETRALSQKQLEALQTQLATLT